jgi:hypothetical protein
MYTKYMYVYIYIYMYIYSRKFPPSLLMTLTYIVKAS